MKNPKRKGTQNEHRSMDILRAAGYRVTRSGASLGEWDVIGVSRTDMVLVQVKTRDWPGLFERQVLRDFEVPPNCRKLIHRWRKYARLPDEQEP